MSNVPAGGFKMGHKGAAVNKVGRKPVKPIKRASRGNHRDAGAIAAFHAESVVLALLPREALVDLSGSLPKR